MAKKSIFVVIMAGGHGTRMKSRLPKILHPLGGLPIGAHVMHLAEKLLPANILCLIPPSDNTEKDNGLKNLFYPHRLLTQDKPLGTGHAAKIAAQEFDKEFIGDDDDRAVVVFLYGDSPLFRLSTIEKLISQLDDHDLALLTFQSSTQYPYGRLQIKNHQVVDIIEAKDYAHTANNQEQNSIFNSGIMAVKWQLGDKNLYELLTTINADNQAGEYYLTDLVKIVSSMGLKTTYQITNEEECLGINNQNDLANATKILQDRWRQNFMAHGVHLPDPSSVFFSHDTTIEPDVTIEPFVMIHPEVHIASGAVIKSFSHLSQTQIGKNAIIGPYARIRYGTKIMNNAKVGNFVEIKNTIFGTSAKANHLTYLGDSDIGENANIGAGAITCNYDGEKKSQTTIGKNAFIGSNSALVAPIKIGEGAVVGAGSTITKDVDKDALAIERSQQASILGYRQKKWKNKK
ncbi:MAG: bifunctional UDP-N-acetylglucosamine diphosphorylase/glucosamine-1-phosphate N-acetyltransferase GlmU [Alphaproteobacteria bacterium]